MPLTIGETFAGYRVLRLLGSGGMGEVYLVQHPRLPRQEALKVLRSDISSDESFRERFLREADLAAGLRHPSIVSIHDRGEHDGQLWIAMDYIEGIDAGRLVERKYPAGMPCDLVVRIVTAVASALDYAHKKGLLHRDVKPANIIVADLDGKEPEVYLADFGIARPLDDTRGLTTTNMAVGTVAYAAPEQLMGDPMDGRADEYALAATTYHLLTGSQLFENSNPAVVISRHLNAVPPDISDKTPGLADLQPVLAAGLAKLPANRFGQCSDFAQALDECVRTNTPNRAAPTTPAAVTVKPAMRSPEASSAAPGRRGRRRTVEVTAAAIAVVATIVLVLVWTRNHLSTTVSPTTPPLTSSSAATANNDAPIPTSPLNSATSTDSSSPSIAPTTTPAAAELTPQNYALPGCTRDGGVAQLPTSANPTCNRQHWFEGVTWTAWGPNGADGTGIEQLQTCNPYCAAGEIFRNRVELRFSGGTSGDVAGGCPTMVQFYTQMIVAYPDLTEVPFETNPDYAVVTRYNGMPAVRYNNLETDCRPTPNI
ncbi:protein kinase [Mycolicibacterium sp. 018/SC-01/001]|uniref:serine/threonine protein kinase n=1 Tax=Mycolicibacterium sp. 018/SC-01/001 TaxID=2592069 RepID=UPI00117F7641|nr:serine/threonine protein kinase [Mycolicibacterium sp. 018/SC-01/001]TRW81253.1 protein kinase [Mycolicibacterium sp. 018/SC-01/001]